MRYVCLSVLSALSISVSNGVANDLGVVRGEVTCDHCSSYSDMVVDITDSARQPVSASQISSNGSFEIRNAHEGSYQITVRNARGDVIHQDTIAVSRHSPVEITIPEQKVERPVSGTISVARLQHKVPKQARREFDKANKLLKKGDLKGSLQHLLKAVEIDPEYMEAHNNLGSRHMMLDQYDLALSAFRRALELDPGSTAVQLNMAVAMMGLRDHKQAEDVARRVLHAEPANQKANYLLGLALYSQKQYTNETVKRLTEAEEHFPNARLAVAAIHAMRGEPMRAKTELETYIAAPNAPNRDHAKTMLAQLQNGK